MYSSVVLRTLTSLYNQHHHPATDCFTSKMKLCPNYVLIPHSPSSPALASTSVRLIFKNLPPLRTSYEWNHTIFVLCDGVFSLSFFLPVVKQTQHKIDHLSIFSAQVSGIKSIHLLCSHHHHASPSSFFLKPEAPLDRTHLPLPQPLTTTTLLSVFIDLPTLQT